MSAFSDELLDGELHAKDHHRQQRHGHARISNLNSQIGQFSLQHGLFPTRTGRHSLFLELFSWTGGTAFWGCGIVMVRVADAFLDISPCKEWNITSIPTPGTTSIQTSMAHSICSKTQRTRERGCFEERERNTHTHIYEEKEDIQEFHTEKDQLVMSLVCEWFLSICVFLKGKRRRREGLHLQQRWMWPHPELWSWRWPRCLLVQIRIRLYWCYWPSGAFGSSGLLWLMMIFFKFGGKMGRVLN